MRQPGAQVVQVPAVCAGQELHRVGEVGLVVGRSPGPPGPRVVTAGHPDGPGEDVRMPQREQHGVERAHRRAGDGDVVAAAALVPDERHHLPDDPVLVTAVLAGPVGQRHPGRRPRRRVEGRHAEHGDPAVVDRRPHGVQHPVVLEIPGRTALGREPDHRASPVPVHGDLRRTAERRGIQPVVLGARHPGSPVKATVPRRSTQRGRSDSQPRAPAAHGAVGALPVQGTGSAQGADQLIERREPGVPPADHGVRIGHQPQRDRVVLPARAPPPSPRC